MRWNITYAERIVFPFIDRRWERTLGSPDDCDETAFRHDAVTLLKQNHIKPIATFEMSLWSFVTRFCRAKLASLDVRKFRSFLHRIQVYSLFKLFNAIIRNLTTFICVSCVSPCSFEPKNLMFEISGRACSHTWEKFQNIFKQPFFSRTFASAKAFLLLSRRTVSLQQKSLTKPVFFMMYFDVYWRNRGKFCYKNSSATWFELNLWSLYHLWPFLRICIRRP